MLVICCQIYRAEIRVGFGFKGHTYKACANDDSIKEEHGVYISVTIPFIFLT